MHVYMHVYVLHVYMLHVYMLHVYMLHVYMLHVYMLHVYVYVYVYVYTYTYTYMYMYMYMSYDTVIHRQIRQGGLNKNMNLDRGSQQTTLRSPQQTTGFWKVNKEVEHRMALAFNLTKLGWLQASPSFVAPCAIQK